MKKLEKYITLDEFARCYGVKSKTILSKEQLPFEIIKIENVLYIEKGNRYPYDKKHLKKIENKPDSFIKFSILHATSIRRYVDNYMLKIDDIKFERLLKNLVETGYLILNSYGVNKGANTFDITDKGEWFVKKYLEEEKNDKFFAKLEKLFIECVASSSKGAVSAIVDKYLPQ